MISDTTFMNNFELIHWLIGGGLWEPVHSHIFSFFLHNNIQTMFRLNWSDHFNQFFTELHLELCAKVHGEIMIIT
jgi:hypothetical protein